MSAEIAFVDGHVFTAVSGAAAASAITVENGGIGYVGTSDGAREHISSKTRIVDLGGRLLTPGFQDAHVHPGPAGIAMGRVPLRDCDSAGEAVAAVAAYASDHPDLDWIVGSGWSQDWFDRGCPDRAMIDRVVSDRPVYLENRDGHGGWVNSLALERAEISASTPDPADGRIERLPDGFPQGTLHEGARYLITKLIPEDRVADLKEGLLEAQRLLFAKGITAWQDAHVDGKTHRAYLELADDGLLKARVAGALWWVRHRGIEQLEELIARSHETSGTYRPVGVKLMLDGVVENFTASMLEPYLSADGALTDNTGIDFIDPELLARIVTAIDGAGLSCHFHAIGDAAVRQALDAVKAIGSLRGRHHVAHLQVVHPADVARFGQLGVSANCQALWACNETYQLELTQPFLGAERSGWQYPFGSLQRAGAHLAMGSDWDVSTPDVFEQADVAVHRTYHTHPDARPLNSDEALTRESALVAFTAGSAYVNHLDQTTGTLEVGKRADLAVMDHNPLLEDRLAPTQVDMTLVDGKVVYER